MCIKKLFVFIEAPRQPELDLRGGADSLGVYKINDVLEASCIVSDGRPVANLSWFLGERNIFVKKFVFFIFLSHN